MVDQGVEMEAAEQRQQPEIEREGPPASGVGLLLKQIGELMGDGRTGEARQLAERLATSAPDHPSVQHVIRVLAPAKVYDTGECPARSFDAELLWIREHGPEYAGRWLAIKGDQLIVQDLTLERLRAKLRQLPEGKGALVHFQSGGT